MTAADLALIGIDSATILSVYSWGFASVLGAFFSGYGVQLAIGMIRKL